MNSSLNTLCKQLHLGNLSEEALNYAKHAEQQKLSHVDYLTSLLEHVWEDKLQRRALRRIKEAQFPYCKTLESFDFSRAPYIPEGRIRQLTNNDYIARAQPILLIGEPGTGKTHLAIAFGHHAASHGYSVKFVTLSQLATQLTEAKNNQQLNQFIKSYAKVDVLIVDELGYTPLTRSDAELVFRVFGQRQEQKPLIITTNLAFQEWTNVFTDPRLCKAILDRLIHHAHIIETGEKSIRLAESMSQNNT